jgi:uncharacterized membrane protein YhaH (DUF805 family)
MIDFYKNVVVDNYANFSGRARRSEYWYFILCHIFILFLFMMLFGIATSISEEIGFVIIGLSIMYVLAIIIPTLAVIVRRLHDIGKSGVYIFIRLIPFIGGIWFLILLCTDGDFGENMYGEDPKRIFD